MTSAKYRMTIDIRTARALTTMLELVDESPDYAMVQTFPLSGPEPLPPSMPPPQPATPQAEVAAAPKTDKPARYVGGKRDKGIRGRDLVIETLKSGSADLSELEHVLVHRGFAKASAAPYISRMLRDGTIERGMHGRFKLKSGATNGAGRAS